MLPAWLGLGTALRAAREAHGLELLREMETGWPFFAGLLSNAEMACAKADAGIARRYVDLWEADEPRERIWATLGAELEHARRAAAGARRGAAPGPRARPAGLDRPPQPVRRPALLRRVELLRRLRAGGLEDVDALGRLSLLTVNGIASGLRNTG